MNKKFPLNQSPPPVAQSAEREETTHSLIEDTAVLLESHGCEIEADLIRGCKANVVLAPIWKGK